MKFTVVLTEDEERKGIYTASVPALPGLHTWGRGKRQAYERALEAMEAYLESLRAAGDPIPKEAGSRVIES